MEFFSLIGLAMLVFAVTDIDDVFLLVGFFADPRFKTRQILLGQYLGIATLFGVSAIGSLVSLVLAPEHVGLLGLLPVAIGIRGLLEAGENDDQPESHGASGRVLAVAAVTIANGGDNIGVYTPFFATRTAMEILMVGAVFAVLTALWVYLAHWLVSHRSFGAPIRRYGERIVPFVLIGLGIFIMAGAGTFGMVMKWVE